MAAAIGNFFQPHPVQAQIVTTWDHCRRHTCQPVHPEYQDGEAVRSAVKRECICQAVVHYGKSPSGTIVQQCKGCTMLQKAPGGALFGGRSD